MSAPGRRSRAQSPQSRKMRSAGPHPQSAADRQSVPSVPYVTSRFQYTHSAASFSALSQRKLSVTQSSPSLSTFSTRSQRRPSIPSVSVGPQNHLSTAALSTLSTHSQHYFVRIMCTLSLYTCFLSFITLFPYYRDLKQHSNVINVHFLKMPFKKRLR